MKRLSIYMLAAGMAALSTSCSDFLDTVPKDQLAPSTTWQTEADAKGFIVGCYKDLLDGNTLLYLDCGSDIGYNNFPWEGFRPWGDGSLSSSNPGQILYDYKSIRKANTFLENVDKVTFSSDAVKANYVAQAKAIRAYKYFLMNWWYGGVPIISSYSSADEAKVERNTEQEVREIATKREQLQREQALRAHSVLSLDEIGRRIARGGTKELNIVVKGDVDGSVEALSDSLEKLSTDKIKVSVILKSVGQISENDVALAAASQAIIIGFQVRPSVLAKKQADQQGVEIRLYSIIYDAIGEVKLAMEGMLEPVVKEEVTATIEVRQVFHISKVGFVAGAFVSEGKVSRSDKARLIRDGIVIQTANIAALKRFKDDVKEVGANFECGISLANCNDLKEGDVIETFKQVEVKATL